MKKIGVLPFILPEGQLSFLNPGMSAASMYRIIKRSMLILGMLLATILVAGQNDNVQFYQKGSSIYVGGDTIASAKPSLYIKGSYQVDSSALVNQTGKSVLTGDFINNVTEGNVFDAIRTGQFRFEGDRAQYIRGAADRVSNYIHFPETLVIDNRNTTDLDSVFVVLDPLMGASTKNVVLERGRLILDSKLNGERYSDVAHLLIEPGGDVTYNRDGVAREDHGIIQVNLALGDNYNQKRLTGFTPPFQTMYSDYLMFQFLTQPTNAGLFGDSGMLINDHMYPMRAGTGYIVGLGIVEGGDPYYYAHMDSSYVDVAYEDRVKDVLSLARDFAPENLTQFVTASDCFEGEKLCVNDVTVELREGFNYLGNPYTVPLDMTEFVGATNMGDWGVTRTGDGSGDVYNSFYVMSEGFGTYDRDMDPLFTFSVTYLVGQAVGSTIDYPGGSGSLLVAPMQMFVVEAVNPVQMKIPMSARSHGMASYLRSMETPVTDELLIETKDKLTGGYDRLCIVFREDASMASNDLYDAAKIFNTSGGVNQIYTTSSDHKKMTTNVVPSTLKKMAMHLTPSNQPQEVSLEAYRLQSLISVDQVFLEDTQTGVISDLMENAVYTFLSSPSDDPDRFILHFDERSVTGIDDEDSDDGAISIFYNSGIIHIRELSDRYIGSTVSVYDMNGHLLHQDIIDVTPNFEMNKYLHQGIYVVKVKGEKISVTEKLLIK